MELRLQIDNAKLRTSSAESQQRKSPRPFLANRPGTEKKISKETVSAFCFKVCRRRIIFETKFITNEQFFYLICINRLDSSRVNLKVQLLS